jgi:hypothetical protein
MNTGDWIFLGVMGAIFLPILWFIVFIFVPGVWQMEKDRQRFIRKLEEAQRNGLNVKHFLAGSGLLKPEYEAEAQRELLELRIRALEKKAK